MIPTPPPQPTQNRLLFPIFPTPTSIFIPFTLYIELIPLPPLSLPIFTHQQKSICDL